MQETGVQPYGSILWHRHRPKIFVTLPKWNERYSVPPIKDSFFEAPSWRNGSFWERGAQEGAFDPF